MSVSKDISKDPFLEIGILLGQIKNLENRIYELEISNSSIKSICECYKKLYENFRERFLNFKIKK